MNCDTCVTDPACRDCRQCQYCCMCKLFCRYCAESNFCQECKQCVYCCMCEHQRERRLRFKCQQTLDKVIDQQFIDAHRHTQQARAEEERLIQEDRCKS